MLGKKLILLMGGARGRLNAILGQGGTVANYRQGVGLTGTTNASAWANQIGIAGPLLQATGGAQPAIQGDGSLLFDGTDDFMRATFTLVQPETVYIVFKQVTWSLGGQVFDGAITNMQLSQRVSTPSLQIFAGAFAATNGNLALNTYGVATSVFNSTSSSLKIDSTTATTGDAGVTNGGGITVGANSINDIFGNIQVKEVIIRNVADSAGTQATIQRLLKAIHGTP